MCLGKSAEEDVFSKPASVSRSAWAASIWDSSCVATKASFAAVAGVLQCPAAAVAETRAKNAERNECEPSASRAIGASSAGMNDSSPVRWCQLSGQEFVETIGACGIHQTLERAGGIVQVLDIFPHEFASQIFHALEGLPEDQWYHTKTRLSFQAGHEFDLHEYAKQDNIRALDKSIQAFVSLVPRMHPEFSVARYREGCHIGLHNDMLEKPVLPEHVHSYKVGYPPGTFIYRKIAFVYYLTPHWKREYGGCFIDCVKDAPCEIVPQFNSLVVFPVPREHEVTAMSKDAPDRYSIFGWFYDDEPYDPGHPPLGSGNPPPRTSLSEALHLDTRQSAAPAGG